MVFLSVICTILSKGGSDNYPKGCLNTWKSNHSTISGGKRWVHVSLDQCNCNKEDTDPGKDWRQEEKGVTEDEMVRCNHRLNRHVLAQTPAEDEGQGSLGCFSPWGHKESDVTWQLNSSNNCSSNVWNERSVAGIYCSGLLESVSKKNWKLFRFLSKFELDCGVSQSHTLSCPSGKL